MKTLNLKKIIAEEIRNVLNEDAFRRIVITTTKADLISDEANKFIARPDMKQNYPCKIKITPGVKPNTLVIDISGSGATVMGMKLSDLAKKFDKAAIVKTKQEIKRTAVKEGTDSDLSNYMFFEDLKSIKRMAEKLLALDCHEVDELICNGHDWAEDHVANAKSKLGEVTGFFMNHFEDSSTALVTKL